MAPAPISISVASILFLKKSGCNFYDSKLLFVCFLDVWAWYCFKYLIHTVSNSVAFRLFEESQFPFPEFHTVKLLKLL
jgi:hypothetical protein